MTRRPLARASIHAPTRALCAGAALLVGVALTPSLAAAQITTMYRARVEFASGVDSAGYSGGSIPLRYAFINCLGVIRLAMEMVPEETLASAPYFLDGREIPAGTEEPLPPAVLELELQVRHRAGGTISSLRAIALSGSRIRCSADAPAVGTVDQILGRGKSAAETRAFLAELEVVVAPVSRTLRNPGAEAAVLRSGDIAAPAPRRSVASSPAYAVVRGVPLDRRWKKWAEAESLSAPDTLTDRWYRERVASLFANSEPVDGCPATDEVRPIALGATARGALRSSSCQLATGQPAALYALTIREPTVVHLIAYEAEFRPEVTILRAEDDTPLVRAPALPFGRATRARSWLEPGNYLVRIAATLPGESGAYELHARRAVRSFSGRFQLGLATSVATASHDIQGESFSRTQEIWIGVETVPNVSLVQMIQMGPNITHFSIGLRTSLGSPYRPWRVLGEWRVGAFDRVFDGPTDDGPGPNFFGGSGPTFGLGVEWHIAEGRAIEAMLEHSSLHLWNFKERAPYAETRLRFSFNFLYPSRRTLRESAW